MSNVAPYFSWKCHVIRLMRDQGLPLRLTPTEIQRLESFWYWGSLCRRVCHHAEPHKAGGIMSDCEKHCWHPTGYGWSRGTGQAGADKFRCCHCALEREVEWEMIRHGVPGHGQYVATQTKQYKDPEVASTIGQSAND